MCFATLMAIFRFNLHSEKKILPLYSVLFKYKWRDKFRKIICTCKIKKFKHTGRTNLDEQEAMLKNALLFTK